LGERGAGELARYRVGQLGDHFVQSLEIVDGAEMVGEQEGGGVGLMQDVGELAGAVAGVEGDDHEAQARGGVLGDEPQRAVGEPDRQRVTAAEAEGGKAVGEGVDTRAKVGEGDARAAEHDGRSRAVTLRHCDQHLVRGRLGEGIRRHGTTGAGAGLSSGVLGALPLAFEVLGEGVQQPGQRLLLGAPGHGDGVLHGRRHPIARVVAIDLDLELHGAASGRLVSHLGEAGA